MKCILTTGLLILLTLTSYTYDGITPQYRQFVMKSGQEVIVAKVINVDTLEVYAKDKKHFNIQLIGIQGITHDMNPKLYYEAVYYISRIVLGQKVFIIKHTESKLDNTPSQYFLYYPHNPKYLLNANLLLNGYAKTIISASHWLREEFKDLEKEAQSNKSGLWKDLSIINNHKKLDKKTPPTDNIKKPLRMFNDPQELAIITAKLFKANNDKEKIDKILKKYNIITKQDLDNYLKAVEKYSDDTVYLKTLNNEINKK